MISVQVLKNYLEFDRVNFPAPRVAFFHEDTVQTLAEKIERDGLQEHVTLSVYNDQDNNNLALVTDGNHRVAALDLLGRPYVAVKVKLYESISELRDSYYSQTIVRFKTVGPDIKNILDSIAA